MVDRGCRGVCIASHQVLQLRAIHRQLEHGWVALGQILHKKIGVEFVHSVDSSRDTAVYHLALGLNETLSELNSVNVIAVYRDELRRRVRLDCYTRQYCQWRVCML